MDSSVVVVVMCSVVLMLGSRLVRSGIMMMVGMSNLLIVWFRM